MQEPSGPPPIAHPKTARSQLSDALRDAILSGRFVPGQRLVEVDLCESFAASRRQVKAAVTALEHEGLIEQIPHRGARVRVIGVQEALDLSEARLALEAVCLHRAASRLTPEAEIELRRLYLALKTAAQTGARESFAMENGALTALYTSLAAQPVVADILAQLRDRNRHHSNRVSWTQGWLQTALPKRLALIEALLAGDGPAAVAALQAHNQLWQEAMLALSARDRPAPSE